MTEHDMALVGQDKLQKRTPPTPIKEPTLLFMDEDGKVGTIPSKPKKVITIDGKTYHVYNMEDLDWEDSLSEFLGL